MCIRDSQNDETSKNSKVTFKTSKGSSYEVHKDGTTTRNKSYHAEHGGDEGLKPRSSKTVYVTKDDLSKLDLVQAIHPDSDNGAKFGIVHEGDKIGVASYDKEGNGNIVKRTIVKPETEPKVGLYPVELWNGHTQPHFGNEITEINNKNSPIKSTENENDKKNAKENEARNPEGGNETSKENPSSPEKGVQGSGKQLSNEGSVEKAEPVTKPETKVDDTTGGKQVKKTILTQRAYEGEIQDDVKKHLEEKGLTRSTFSQQERSKQATELINKFGDDGAYYAVKSGDIDGALAASTLVQLQIKNNHAIEDAKTPEEREALAKKQADYIDLMEKKGYLGGEFNGQLAHEYQNEELNYANIKRNIEKGTGKKISSEQEAKIKKYVKQIEDLKKQVDEHEAKLIEETNKAFEAGKEEVKNETKSQKAKRIADKIRSAKIHRPGIFSAATPASVAWDTAVEITAKSVEAGGVIADAVKAGVAHIKSTNWYKKLSESKKQEAEYAFANHFNDLETDRSAYIKRLNNSIEALDEQISKGEKEIKSKTDKYKDDKEIEELRKLRDEKRKELNRVDTKHAEETKRKANIKRLESELERIKDNREKETPQKREPSDREKELADQIKQEQQKIDLENLQDEFDGKKDNKFTPEEAGRIWKYMRETYIDNGTSYRDAISKTAEDLGLTWRQISEAIITPKLKRTSDEMWKKQADLARNRYVVKSWVNDQNKNAAYKLLTKISGLFRGVAVFGHGGIFVGTHAGMTLFEPKTMRKTIKAFFNGWKFAYGNEANYERSMEELQNSPNYLVAQRAGLNNNPERMNAEEYQKSQKYLGKLGIAGERGFNAIKILRQDLFDHYYNKLSPAERDDPNVAKSIAYLINNATGATNTKLPSWVNEVTFAGGMEASRWGKLLKNPTKAAGVALKTITDPESASASDRVFAKIWAKRVGTELAVYTGALIANAALQNQINPNNPVNLTHPGAPDFGKFKVGDFDIDPTSGMRGTASFMYGLGKIPFNDKVRGEDRLQTAGKKVFGYSRGKLSPLYGTVADIFSSQDFGGNVLPWSDDTPGKNKRQLSYGEYASSKLPLPLAETFSTIYKSAEDSGTDPYTFNNVLNGFITGAISGGTGIRVSKHNDSDFSIKK